ncbi:hypothetical protein CVU75_01440, partial [Candidatus Dependentiae bacterium HGW-Dependentiae-1]
DCALKVQLEADILWSFRDGGALKKYEQAAELFTKERRLLEAAAVFEHILTLAPHSLYALDSLIQLYLAMGSPAKVMQHAIILIEVAGAQKEVSRMRELVRCLEAVLEPAPCAQLYQYFTLALLKQDEPPHELIVVAMKKAIDLLLMHNQSKALQQFLSQLQAINSRYYQQACRFIQDDKDSN